MVGMRSVNFARTFLVWLAVGVFSALRRARARTFLRHPSVLTVNESGKLDDDYVPIL